MKFHMHVKTNIQIFYVAWSCNAKHHSQGLVYQYMTYHFRSVVHRGYILTDINTMMHVISFKMQVIRIVNYWAHTHTQTDICKQPFINRARLFHTYMSRDKCTQTYTYTPTRAHKCPMYSCCFFIIIIAESLSHSLILCCVNE